MPQASSRFVYLLRDPREADRRMGVFYCGVGTRDRPLDHIADARARLRASAADAMAVINSADSTMRVRPGYTFTVEESDELDEAERLREDADAKLDLINEIEAAGHDVIIEVIHGTDGYLTEHDAFTAEAAIIAAYGLTAHGNKVAGHRLALTPESVFTLAAKAEEVDIYDLPGGHHGIIVPLAPNDEDMRLISGQLLAADQKHVWERARRWWGNSSDKVVARVRKAIADADDVSPTVIAVTRNPLGGRGNIVLGVFQLAALGPASDGDERWEYWKADVEDAATAELRERLVGNAPVLGGKLVTHRQDRTYFGGRYGTV